ncbi:MAG: hemolysin D [Oceanospirillaceae bacterium]|nr:hemolysin D [Oceanospirillaceae bacterium]MBT11469.1 hemolysin D [Oceanospirillaceae bacterium]|tara:strand:- start:19354 stop:20358 length:1005 start_codon:yes stop_codon:yes gene_type:complete
MPKKVRVLIVLAVVAIAGGVWWWMHQGLEETDNAYVKADILPVMSRVQGSVLNIAVTENQAVSAGDLLVQLDPAPYQARVAQAQALLDQARANLNHLSEREEAQKALVTAAEASVAAARADWQRTGQQLDRLKQLRGKQYVSQDDIDAAELNRDASRARLNQARAQLASQKANLVSMQGEKPQLSAAVDKAAADLTSAELNLAYTGLRAARDGVVTSQQVQLGQMVSPELRLFSLVTQPLWVYANFKETQVADIRAGQAVDIEIDALPDTVFKGKVDSFFAATGSEFALIPPQNATGNFTKVTQRLPVKIVFEEGQDLSQIRAGMSVIATVFTE